MVAGDLGEGAGSLKTIGSLLHVSLREVRWVDLASEVCLSFPQLHGPFKSPARRLPDVCCITPCLHRHLCLKFWLAASALPEPQFQILRIP